MAAAGTGDLFTALGLDALPPPVTVGQLVTGLRDLQDTTHNASFVTLLGRLLGRAGLGLGWVAPLPNGVRVGPTRRQETFTIVAVTPPTGPTRYLPTWHEQGTGPPRLADLPALGDSPLDLGVGVTAVPGHLPGVVLLTPTTGGDPPVWFSDGHQGWNQVGEADRAVVVLDPALTGPQLRLALARLQPTLAASRGGPASGCTAPTRGRGLAPPRPSRWPSSTPAPNCSPPTPPAAGTVSAPVTRPPPRRPRRGCPTCRRWGIARWIWGSGSPPCPGTCPGWCCSPPPPAATRRSGLATGIKAGIRSARPTGPWWCSTRP